MHFIEQLFGTSPDAGSGSLELALVLLPFALTAVYRVRRALLREVTSGVVETS